MAYFPENMNENIQQLKETVEQAHHCTAVFSETITVSEIFQGKPAWEGTVYIFNIKGNPAASLCYAWSSLIEGSSKRRYFAVLHSPPVASAQDAVRAAIVQEYKTTKKN